MVRLHEEQLNALDKWIEERPGDWLVTRPHAIRRIVTAYLRQGAGQGQPCSSPAVQPPAPPSVSKSKKKPAKFRDASDIARHVNEAMASQHTEAVLEALGDAAKAHGLSEVSRQTGLRRENLYSSLSARGNPGLANVMKVLDALGLELRVQVRQQYGSFKHRPVAQDTKPSSDK
jgi:probable addiction module antidote protein